MAEVDFSANSLICYCQNRIFFTSHIFIMFWLSGSFGGSDVGGMYSSSYGGDYVSRGSDVIFLSFLNLNMK